MGGSLVEWRNGNEVPISTGMTEGYSIEKQDIH